jgi:hypothetical protein
VPDTDNGRVTLAVLRSDILHLTKEFERGMSQVTNRLDHIDACVRHHETRLSILEKFCDEQVKPMMQIVNDSKLELARLVARYTGIGVGGGSAVGLILYAIGKSLGVW